MSSFVLSKQHETPTCLEGIVGILGGHRKQRLSIACVVSFDCFEVDGAWYVFLVGVTVHEMLAMVSHGARLMPCGSSNNVDALSSRRPLKAEMFVHTEKLGQQLD
jgi:hypothetical protein